MKIAAHFTNILIVLPILLFNSCSGEKSADIKPNILLISIDDLNNWIEPMGGHPQAQTPNLQSFAENAITFQNAYCASPSCNPSRTALFTGKHTYITGLYNNPQVWRDIVGDELTMPEYFRNNGYWVAGAGKIYHGNMPDKRSWDEYFPDKIKHMPDYYLPAKDPVSGDTLFVLQDNEIREDDPKGITFNMPWYKGLYIAFDWNPLPYKTEETGDYSSANWIIDQLKKDHDKPFFLACGLYRPHLPWYVPQEFYDKFPIETVELPAILSDDWSDLPESARKTANGKIHQKVLEAGQWEAAVQGYLSSISYADYIAGMVLEALKESEYADNTIVVIFSDHGWQLGEKQHWRKFALWENVINSVLMVKVPEALESKFGKFQYGRESVTNVSLLDIFPTLTELCEIPPKEGVSGESLIPVLMQPLTYRDRAIISTLGDNNFSVIKKNWHYILYNGTDEELYNLDKDPEEWYNLASDEEYSEIIKSLRKEIPDERHELIQTRSIRWEDVLSGETLF